jgi:hypothetical protein
LEEVIEPVIGRLPPPAIHVKARFAPEKAELRVADEKGRLSFRFELELLAAIVDVDLPHVVVDILVVPVTGNRRVIVAGIVHRA